MLRKNLRTPEGGSLPEGMEPVGTVETAESHPLGAEISSKVEESIPSIEEVNDLLEASDQIVALASMPEEEIDKMFQKRQEVLDRLQKIDSIQESRLEKVENYNPLQDLELSDYQRLVDEEVIDDDFAVKFKATPSQLVKTFADLDSRIAQFESLSYLSVDNTSQMQRLLAARNVFRKNLEEQLEEKRQELAARRDKVKNNVLAHYSKRVKQLQETVDEISANSRVLAKVEELARKAEEERKAAEQEREKNDREREREFLRLMQSVESRQANGDKRWDELFGDQFSSAELRELLRNYQDTESSGAPKQEREKARTQWLGALNKAKDLLFQTILDGKDEKEIKSAQELVPRDMKSSIDYYDAFNELMDITTQEFLSERAQGGSKAAQRILDSLGDLKLNDDLDVALFGKRKWEKRSHDPAERKLSPFYAALELRKKNDENGITEERQKALAAVEARRAEFQKKAAEIVDRGGWLLNAPIEARIKGKSVKTGTFPLAVRVEKRKSTKTGNEYWVVAELQGGLEDNYGGLKVGLPSKLDFSQYPEWFRNAISPYLVKESDGTFTLLSAPKPAE